MSNEQKDQAAQEQARELVDKWISLCLSTIRDEMYLLLPTQMDHREKRELSDHAHSLLRSRLEGDGDAELLRKCMEMLNTADKELYIAAYACRCSAHANIDRAASHVASTAEAWREYYKGRVG